MQCYENGNHSPIFVAGWLTQQLLLSRTLFRGIPAYTWGPLLLISSLLAFEKQTTQIQEFLNCVPCSTCDRAFVSLFLSTTNTRIAREIFRQG
jgi:hypothetical protein